MSSGKGGLEDRYLGNTVDPAQQKPEGKWKDAEKKGWRNLLCIHADR